MFRTAALVFLLLCFPATAQADDWSDARSDFRAAQRDEDWQERRAAYISLLDYDGAEVVKELLAATLREKNAAVVLTGIKTLGELESETAHSALLKALKNAKGYKAQVLLMALGAQKGQGSVDSLIAILAGKEPQLAALAALALGEKASEAALKALLAALDPGLWKKDWHVAAAAARGIEKLAWSAWTKPKNPNEGKKPAMPSWFKPKEVLWPLIDRLEIAKGRERGDLIQTLESITKKDYGYNLAAWVAHAEGAEPDAATLRKRIRPPYFFGVPVYGRRLVIVMDVNVLTDNEHPFKDRARLKEICAVPGARDVPWFKIRSIKQLLAAHVVRTIRDLPTRGPKFELILSSLKPKQVFGKLTPVNGGSKNSAIEAVEKAKVSNGNDILAVMNEALDISGKKDAVAWTKGPDQIICVYSSIPWLAAETDAVVVGSTIGLKARRRLVQIHAVGVHEFAYAMMKLFASQSGGRYVPFMQ